MNKNIGVIIGVIVLAVIVGGIYASTNSKNDAMMAKEQMEQKATEEKKAIEEKDVTMKAGATTTDSMMKKDETSMMVKSDTIMKAGSYEAYSADKIARAETGDVVLFFHASWCPSCRGLNSNIESNLKSIPEDVTILKTDYDKETELKKKYGVTYQHTLVQVDKNGNLIKKWSGGSTLDNLLSQIQ
jgi:thiol-disulfide isomerase/thioredoxin